MGMIGRAFDKLDAGKIFPVTHGLFEEGLVGPGEIGINLVGDDSEIPDALLAGRCRPSGTD